MLDLYRYTYDIPLDDTKSYTYQARRDVVASVLNNSIRVTDEIFPIVSKSINLVKRKLKITDQVDFFIIPDNTPNAYCQPIGNNKSIIIIHSSLIELLSSEELMFIIGHELGHHVYKHYLSQNQLNSSRSLNDLYLDRSRKMEISCDRVGLLAIKDFNIASKSIIKMVSGLGDKHIKNNPKIFLKQLKELSEIGIYDESDRTHHSWLIRMQALVAFSQSSEYYAYIGKNDNGKTLSSIDKIIEQHLNKLTGIDPDKKEDEIYEMSLLFVLCKYLHQNLDINEGNAKILFNRFDKELVEKLLSYLSGCSLEKLNDKIIYHLGSIANLNHSKRVKFYKEITTIIGSSNYSKNIDALDDGTLREFLSL